MSQTLASLLWKESGGKNEIYVIPSKVTGLSKVLELFNIRIWVSGERAKVLFCLREVSKGKGDMDPHNAFCSSHFPERVDGNQLTWGSMRVSVGGGSWGPVVLGSRGRGRRKSRRTGRRAGRKRGGKRGRRAWSGGPRVEQWKPVTDKVEAH
jgi:hypothetical protein